MTSSPTNPTAARIGANIDRAMHEKGLTLREVAIAVGANEGQVSTWRLGKHAPRRSLDGTDYIVALADLLFDGDVNALYREPEAEIA